MCEASRQQVFNSRKTVAYMKLFLEEVYNLDEKAKKFKEQAMKYGNLAEASVYEFLRQRGIASHGTGLMIKHMRVAHREGALIERILSYNALLATDAITDPSPPKSQNILNVVKDIESTFDLYVINQVRTCMYVYVQRLKYSHQFF